MTYAHMFECDEYNWSLIKMDKPRECICPDDIKDKIKKKIFIFGTSGLVGSKLVEYAHKDFDVYGSYNLRKGYGINLDVTDWEIVKTYLDNANVDIIINATALNNVDYCERHQHEANLVNIEFVRNLSKRPEKIVHLSSDLVFDGSKQCAYTEEDPLKAVNHYGFTKIEGEKLVLQNPNNLVVRASVLYGIVFHVGESSSKKPYNFGHWLLNELSNEHEVNIVNDEYSTPIEVNDFAKSILHLVKKDESGVFHSASTRNISRYDFAVELARSFGFNAEKFIKPVSTRELGRNVWLSLNKCLNSVKLQSTGYKFMTLEESFRQMKQDEGERY